jgi:superfamily II DNA or RNA helicase
MSRSVRLRPWQRDALERFRASGAPDFLAVATPGAGKTTFALTAAVQHLAANPHQRIVVVAPTQHLKHQWARAASRFDLHLEPLWSARDGRLPSDMHGIVVTYQQVAMQPLALRGVAHDAFVVFDELHHAGHERAWGEGVRTAFAGAARRLAISGTPFRSDTAAIPFVRYDDFGEAHADYEYGYGDALGDGGVVRLVYFPRIDGQMEWVAPDGSQHSATFDDALDAARSGQRLRTALSLSGEWLPAVLDQAHAQLEAVRATQPHAGGLVIAMDQEHARGIVSMLKRRHGVHATLVVSDDPTASARIEHFTEGDQPWIVAVRMVSEGVDIPRLRVGVFATNTVTELFFRQATGRLVRWTRGMRSQKAFFFIPDDPRLRRFAGGIAEQRRHSLRRRDAEDDGRADDGAELDGSGPTPVQEEQLSLFAALSAVAIGGHEPEWVSDEHDGGPGVGDDPDGLDDADLVVVLAAPPRPGGGADGHHRTRREHKAHLRLENSERARDIARRTGLTHAQVNAELNRISGVGRVSEATVAQLERRLGQADRWLARL